jgi:hypothetical protein
VLSSVPQSKFRVILSLALLWGLTTAAAAANPGFTAQRRVGFTVGDQWEPAIAADGYGHVYILYPQYGEVPDCPNCPIPSMILLTSEDNGSSWQAPHMIAPPGLGQFDPQIVVDPVDRRTVFAAWVQNNKTDVVVARSTDFGQSWSLAVAARKEDIDKPSLAVRGQDVYVAFNFDGKLWASSSHDGGITFAVNEVAKDTFRWTLPSGGTLDPAGTIYFSWAGYTRNGTSKVNLYISKSSDGGKTWLTSLKASSAVAPNCSAYHCGWSYLGAQITVASDAAGTIYALWNAGTVDGGPERIYFSSSTTGGITWSPKVDISSAAPGVDHAFPAIAAGAAGDVRIAWMDTRGTPLWNTFYRSSTNGGATWSGEARISGESLGYSYIDAGGFVFPFGDYFGLAIDSRGQTQAVWGEGLNFRSPGSIWYSSGR